MAGAALAEMDDRALEDEVASLGAHIAAAQARLLQAVAEIDRRQNWARWETTSCAQWLSYVTGCSPRAARDQVALATR